MLRTPIIEKLIDNKNIFKISLIIHVDLSIVVWLLAIGSMLSEYIIKSKYNILSNTALISFIIGMLLITISPITGDSTPIMNNYIPVVDNILFMIGISFIFSGSIIQIIATLLSYEKSMLKDSYYLSVFSTKIINLIAFVSFFISANKMSYLNITDQHYYYELVFWACGHILQFSYVNLMMIAWIILFANHYNKKLINLCFLINLVSSIFSLIAFYLYNIDSIDFREFYTIHMRYLGGLSVTIIGIYIISSIIYGKMKNIDNSLIMSMILFFIGGIIGLLIVNINVTIPAHYHGAIVGVTIAIMGICYRFIDILYNIKINKKWQIIQNYTYGGGQLLHILALGFSGGYGALRKTPGAELNFKAKISMGIMGLGGLTAIIGGIIFVILCFNAIYKSRKIV
jgi:hypothetical protein